MVFDRFFALRGTHLAAMVAFFALASFVPVLFLLLSIVGLLGATTESSALVGYLEEIFPARPVDDIVGVVEAVRRNAGTLSVVGAVGLAWSSVSLISALESAFNLVYDRPNRAFLHGKGVAVVFTLGALVVLFVGVFVGTFGYDLLRRYASGAIGNGVVALILTLLASGIASFLFLLAAYRQLTNAPVSWREALPGAVVGAVVLAATLQGLPLFVWLSGDLVALQTLGTTFLLLFWLYLMANVIVFGSVLNRVLAGLREDVRLDI
jgi:YihY family inner membrane protein